MEPGHEDREYVATRMRADVSQAPQWSPVMKTGNTRTRGKNSHRPKRLNGARS